MNQAVNQFRIFTIMADKLLIKAPQLQKPLAIHQQATAGQGNPFHPVVFTAQKGLQAALKIPVKALCLLLGQIEAGVH